MKAYNALLATHWLLDHTKVRVVFVTEALYQICPRQLDIKTSSYDDINGLVTKCISAHVADGRYEKQMYSPFDQFITNLITFPRIQRLEEF